MSQWTKDYQSSIDAELAWRERDAADEEAARIQDAEWELAFQLAVDAELAEEAAAAQPKCCDDPASYTFYKSFYVCPETGYRDEDYWLCACGSRIGDDDYAQLCAYSDSQMESELEQARRRAPMPALDPHFVFISLRKEVA